MILPAFLIAAGANLCMGFVGGFGRWQWSGDQRICTGNDLATGDSNLRGDGEQGTENEVLRQYRILTGGRDTGFVSAGGSCDVADRMESRVRRGSNLSVCDVSYLDHWV